VKLIHLVGFIIKIVVHVIMYTVKRLCKKICSKKLCTASKLSFLIYIYFTHTHTQTYTYIYLRVFYVRNKIIFSSHSAKSYRVDKNYFK